MIIDSHSHLVDAKVFEASGFSIPSNMLDESILLGEQDRAGVDLSVISGPRVMEAGLMLGNRSAADIAKEYNDYVAGLVSKYPTRFAGLGIAHPLGGDAMFKEMERAVRVLGLKGFLVVPRYDGKFLSEREMWPFLELCQTLDAVVFVHSADGCMCQEMMRENRLVELVGRPNEMTLLAAKLAFSGVMEKLPDLKLLLARLGGAITLYAGRIQAGWESRHTRKDGIEPWGPDLLEHSFLASLKKIHVDTQTFHAPAIRCAVETLGDERVLLGSDFPPVPRPLSASIDDVRHSGIEEKSLQQVLSINSRRLFNLP